MSAADSSSLDRIPIWDRLTDRFNAITIKEARQALKSKQFVATFLLLLAAAWAVSVIGLAAEGAEIEYGAAGRKFFYGFYVVLALATVLVVPFGAYRSLLSERDLNTFDLLSITTLSPGKIVRGKLASATLQLFIFYSAITPFMAFASLLNGFDAPRAAYVLVMSMLGSILLCMATLMFSTLARQRLWQGFLSLVVLAGLGLAFLMDVLFVWDAMEWGALVSLDDPDFLWGTGFTVLGAVSYFVLFHQITVAQLTFDADNRSTGIRLAASAQFWLLWIALGAMFAFSPSGGSFDGDELIALAIICGIHWFVFGLFATTEPDWLSHRVRRDLPRYRIIRLLLLPFLPGGARGYLWLLLHLAGLWFALGTMRTLAGASYAPATPAWTAVSPVSPMTPVPASPAPATPVPAVGSRGAVEVLVEIGRGLTEGVFLGEPSLRFTVALCCYLAIYLGLGCAMGRWLRLLSAELNAAHIRVFTFLGLMAGTLFPVCVKAVGLSQWGEFRWFEITSPIESLVEVSSDTSQSAPMIVMALAAGAGAVILLNTPAILRESRDIFRG